MQQIGEFRHNLASAPTTGKKVVIRSERGVELGEVLMPLCDTEDPGASTAADASETSVWAISSKPPGRNTPTAATERSFA